MPFLACILPVVSAMCDPVMSAVRSSLGTLAQRFFTFLTDWGADQFSSWRGDFEEVPVSTTAIVGAEKTLADIRALLKNDSVRIIGIYGMGGAGKTTLLRRINNELYESRTARGKFDLGIWVTVSKEVSIPDIQKQIARRLRLTLSNDEFRDAGTLFQALSQRRFVVLLDDLWAKLDLVKVGIPVPTDRPNCKIAFTTRSMEVCTDMETSMDANGNGRVKVKPLDDGRSWELFCSKVGTEDLDNLRIQRLAKQVVGKCGGLPLALITVGKAMANRDPGEWELAVKDLDRSAEKLRGMDQVLSCLKLSYDYLKNDKMRSALLYCAMYPEDTEILKDELIEHWIGEGMLDDDDDVDDGIDDTRNRGRALITDLQHSCLLEAGILHAERGVRMHDAVRDLALWLNRKEYDKVDGFMAGEDLIKVANPQRREHVRRIWMRNFSVSPPGVQNWPPNSWTLLLNDCIGEPCLPQAIFNCVRTLRVLDLNGAEDLVELPIEIGCLQDLQYLNLSHTILKSLPKELGKLRRLRQLGLRHTLFLCRIPREAIAGLSSLQVLNMFHCGYQWSAQGDPPAREVSMVDNEENEQHSSSNAGAAEGSGGRQLEVSDVEGLKRLQELGISLKSPHALEKLLRSESPWQCTRYLEVGGFELNLTRDGAHPCVGELRISLDQLPRLEYLDLSMFNCETTTTTTIVLEGTSAESFRRLEVNSSKGWKKLKLLGKFPSLLRIHVSFSDMEEVLLGEDNDGTGSQQDTIQEQHLDCRFPMLQSLWLSKLRDLKSIGRRPPFLPSLESIRVLWCPELSRLPLGPGSAPKLKEICGDQEWWDALEWGTSGGDDPNIKNIFAPFFSTGRSIYPENDLSLRL